MSDSEDELIVDLYSVKCPYSVRELDFTADEEDSVYLTAGALGADFGLPETAFRGSALQVVSIDGHHIYSWSDVRKLQDNRYRGNDKTDSGCALILRPVTKGSTVESPSMIVSQNNIVTPHMERKRSASRLESALKSQGTSVSQSFSSPFHATGSTTFAAVNVLSPGTGDESKYNNSASEREKPVPERPVSAKWAAPRSGSGTPSNY